MQLAQRIARQAGADVATLAPLLDCCCTFALSGSPKPRLAAAAVTRLLCPMLAAARASQVQAFFMKCIGPIMSVIREKPPADGLPDAAYHDRYLMQQAMFRLVAILCRRLPTPTRS